MQAHKSDTSSATLQAMSENHDHAINGLRVLAKIIARFHANRYGETNAEVESHHQREEDREDA